MTSKEFIKSHIVKLEDDLQHYTMVDKDKVKAKYIELELKEYKQVLKDLERLEGLENGIKTIEDGICYEMNIPKNYFAKKEFERIIGLIEEKIENAKNDYRKCFEELDTPLFKSDKLQGEIEAYQDILLLLKGAL